MSVTYGKPNRATLRLLTKARRLYHPRLDAARVRITLLMAYGPTDIDGEVIGPAIKHHGVKALGVVRVVPLKHRVAGLGDAEMILDGDEWENMGEGQRLALLDHELTHIVIKYDGETKRRPGQLEVVRDGVYPAPVLDSADRPKLSMRHHDRSFGWFDEVAKRHGADAFEVQQAQDLADKAGQLYLPEFLTRKVGGR